MKLQIRKTEYLTIVDFSISLYLHRHGVRIPESDYNFKHRSLE